MKFFYSFDAVHEAGVGFVNNTNNVLEMNSTSSQLRLFVAFSRVWLTQTKRSHSAHVVANYGDIASILCVPTGPKVDERFLSAQTESISACLAFTECQLGWCKGTLSFNLLESARVVTQNGVGVTRNLHKLRKA